jgi:ATP-binding cassette subfamily B protein
VYLVWQSNPRLTLLLSLLLGLQGITPVIQLFLIGRVIDSVTTAISNGTFQLQEIAPLVFLSGLVMFIGSVLATASAVVNEAHGLAVADYISNAIHEHSVAIDLEYYENARFHDQLHRAQIEAPYRPPQMVNSLVQLVRDSFSLAGILILLVSLSTFTPLILFVSTLPMVLVRLRFARILFEWRLRSTEMERRASYYDYLLTNEYNAKEVRLLNTGSMFSQRYNAVREQLRAQRLKITTRRGVFESFVQLMSVVALFTAFWLVISDTVAGLLTIGSLVIAFQGFQQGQSTINAVLASFTSLYEHNLFLKEYYAFLNLPIKVARPQNPVPVPVPMREGIRFEGVGFHYAQQSALVLKQLDFFIRPGEVIALVGENGAGKTTLVKLLCRLYDPTEGRITLDGTDLRQFDPATLRQNIAVLFQDYGRYQLTARENIWLGDITQPNDRAEIVRAAEKAGADTMIDDLPKDYDTQLGSWFNGQDLSIGQWQKLSLARAFFRDAQLVVLDEPTSALDVMTEHEVFERFREMIGDRSAVLISHRLSTIRMADRIYVLDNHQIAEVGTHQELMELNGIYAKLFRTQSQYYQPDVD